MKKVFTLFLSAIIIITTILALPYNTLAKEYKNVYLDIQGAPVANESVASVNDSVHINNEGGWEIASLTWYDNNGEKITDNTYTFQPDTHYSATITVRPCDYATSTITSIDTLTWNWSKDVKTSIDYSNASITLSTKFYYIDIEYPAEARKYYASFGETVYLVAPYQEGVHFDIWNGAYTDSAGKYMPAFDQRESKYAQFDVPDSDSTITVEPQYEKCVYEPYEHESTCIEHGYTCDQCTICFDQVNVVCKSLSTHSYEPEHDTYVVKKATPTTDGKVACPCVECGSLKYSTIYKVSKITLSTTSYTYDGKTKKPSVTVKNSKGQTLSNDCYSVTYSTGRKNVGTYNVTVKLKGGSYSGTKALSFKINPKNTSAPTLNGIKKGFKVSWKKQATQTTGYQIQYSTNSAFKNAKIATVASNKTTSKFFTRKKSNIKYYVRIRTYKTVGKTKYYSKWSSTKTVKTK